MARTISTAAVLAALLAPGAAHATTNFPAGVKSHLALSYAPPCAVCHLGGVTQRGTVTTPFGASMRGHGLVAYSASSLNSALDRMATDHTDSDGDGVDDVDELKADTDPNVRNGGGNGADGGTGSDGGGNGGNGAADGPVPPEYGCAIAGGRGTGGGAGRIATALLLLGVLVRRRPRRR